MADSILIIDPDGGGIEPLRSALDESGFQVRTAASGAEGKTEVASLGADLILMSVDLPDGTGYDVAPQLQSAARDLGLRAVPIIYLGSPDGDRLRAFESGGVDYVARPIPVEETLARVNTHLVTSRVRRELHESRTSLEEAFEMRTQELNRQVQLFRKFVPRTFAQVLDSAGFDVRQGLSQEEEFSVLSCDIRGFTTFSESITCTECFRFLNSYFTVMEPGIRNYGGFIYQYVGDSIMALFPPGDDAHADNVIESAIALQTDVLPRYNEGRTRAGYQPIRIGIGVNTGSVAIGIAGTPERMDASAFGSTVNIAARCEELTKEFGAGIVITGDTQARLADVSVYDIRELGPHPIRGMSHPVDLFQVVGYAGGPRP